MSARSLLRSAIVIGVVTAGVPALATLTATPAAAFCFRCFAFGFHPASVSPLVARPGRAIHPTMPSGPALTRLHTPSHVGPVHQFHPRVSSTTGASSGAGQRPCPACRRMTIPKHNDDINPGGPSFSTASPGGAGQSGGQGFGQGFAPSGGGNSSGGPSGFAASSGNGSSGFAADSAGASGGGSGQFTSASVPNGGGSGIRRSLNDTTSRTRAGTSSTTSNTATSTTGAAPTLTAVTACMTRAGSCPMDRDVGTACQCRDTQGNVYDGVVK